MRTETWEHEGREDIILCGSNEEEKFMWEALGDRSRLIANGWKKKEENIITK